MAIKDNVIGKIQLILYNMPKNCSDLEKVRYIYMKLGRIFSYDFRIIMNENLASIPLDFDNISSVETCTQISEILKIVLDKFNNNAEAKVIERPSARGKKYTIPHVGTEVKFTDNVTGIEYKLLLDLTLDLFRIQAGMQTRQFGFTTDEFGSYDIISLHECEVMDRNLDLIPEKGYKEIQINEVKDYLAESPMPLKDKISYMWKKLEVDFPGAHEARQYIEYLIGAVFPNIPFRTYNLYHSDIENEEFTTLFIIEDKSNGEEIYILFDNRIGLMYSSKGIIENMMKVGWKTNSVSLGKVVGYDEASNRGI